MVVGEKWYSSESVDKIPVVVTPFQLGNAINVVCWRLSLFQKEVSQVAQEYANVVEK